MSKLDMPGLPEMVKVAGSIHLIGSFTRPGGGGVQTSDGAENPSGFPATSSDFGEYGVVDDEGLPNQRMSRIITFYSASYRICESCRSRE